jgi:hypothetical protein
MPIEVVLARSHNTRQAWISGVNCSAFLGLASLCACAVRTEKRQEQMLFLLLQFLLPTFYTCVSQCLCICIQYVVFRNIFTVYVHVLQPATSRERGLAHRQKHRHTAVAVVSIISRPD